METESGNGFPGAERRREQGVKYFIGIVSV